MNDFESACSRWRERTMRALSARLPDADGGLAQAMRYACLGGGKRLRAMLVYACGGDPDPAQLDAPAAAVEMMHAYSLIHDDLPAMDDDDVRRGKPACHIAFDQATAILAGDALQSLAFAVLATDAALSVADDRRLLMVATLATAAGDMAGGQALDVVGDADVKRIHELKTGALIRAAARLGGLAAGADAARLARLDDYAADIGLAFQLTDDILDGDRRHDDDADDAKREAQNIAKRACVTAADLGDNATFLKQLALFVVNRSH